MFDKLMQWEVSHPKFRHFLEGVLAAAAGAAVKAAADYITAEGIPGLGDTLGVLVAGYLLVLSKQLRDSATESLTYPLPPVEPTVKT